MNSVKRQTANGNAPIRACFGLVILMLISSLSPLIASSESPTWADDESSHGMGFVKFFPEQNSTSVEATIEQALIVDANRTFTGGMVSIEPLWGIDQSNGTNFGVQSTEQWNGTHQQTNGIGHGGRLTLATEASLGTIANFESTVRTASGWMGTGDDHEAWAVIQPSVTPLVSLSGMVLPSNGSDSLSALSTRGLGDLGPDMSGCIRSPAFATPSFINNYTLTFEHWLALNSDDAAWVEVQTASGAWVTVAPQNGYNATSTSSVAPSSVWNGQHASWASSVFHLDSHLSQLQPSIEVRFCYATGASIDARGGWFIDEVQMQNQGDVAGAWFHGNLSGDYLPNAEGQLALAANVSNLTGQTVELEISSNWDIEGGTKDHLTVWISLDNGTTYSPISNHPGHPNNGALCNGVFFNGPDSNDAWCPVLYNLPWSQTSPANASNVLFRFWVQTDGQNNFGGTASSGWEGIAIDDVSVWIDRGTATQSKTSLANFSVQPSLSNGSNDGWLTYDAVGVNQWQWTASLGNNGATSQSEGFEVSFELPAGWSLDATSNRRWEVGTTSNASGFGPGVWHSGNAGAGIYLDDEYRNNMLTHLYTPEYTLPVNSTSRLTFRSWVCTEASWDGGAVSISTDGGQNWWFLPPTLNGFHDQISTVNSNSPLFGEGILDGSNVAGGCTSSPRAFDLKTFDLSNLSGLEVRARFTFFSDQLVELDGWYIDDAGIEIDVYETQGTWISQPLQPHPAFGWGHVDGFVFQPENTTVHFDVLDANGTAIPGYENRSLPIELALDPIHHPTLQLKVHLATENELLTPSIERLSVGSVHYYDAYHHRNNPFTSVGLNQLSIDQDANLVAATSTSLVWDMEAFCPFQSMVVETYGDNLSATHSGLALEAWTHTPLTPPILRRVLSQTNTPVFQTPLALTWLAGAVSSGFMFEPHCSLAPKAPLLALGGSNTTLFEWPIGEANESFGLNKGFSAFEGELNSVQADDNGALEVIHSGTQHANLSWLMPVNAPFIAGAMAYDVQFLVHMQSNATAGLLEVQQGGPSLALTASSGSTHHRVTHSATCIPSPDSTEANLASCSLAVVLSGSFTATFSQAVIVANQQTIERSIAQSLLNGVADEFKAGNSSSTVVLPLRATTQFGSVAVNLTAFTQPLLVDQVLPISHQRWLPEQTVVFHTQHWRGDANQPESDAPDFTTLELMLSPTKHQNDALVHVQAINLDTTPQLRQLGGVAFAHLLSESSSVICTLNVCNATWALQSTWEFDDVDDVHVLALGTDVNGLSTGPAHSYRQTAFNEIENDLEVVNLMVTDENQRNLNDWSNPQWPFHLNANHSLLATGAVRFQGIAQSYVAQGQAEVRIDATTVPPINISGGPNEWPAEPVNWSSSWLGDVDSNGRFSIGLNAPAFTEQVPSGTRIMISAHLERRGPMEAASATSLDQTPRSSDVPFLFDRIRPSMISLLALDSGGYAPADNHIWMKGQDLALRVTLADAEGLDNTLQMHTWLEARDDVNLDGVMDAEEYSAQTVTFNSGLIEAVVDLPLLGWSDITAGGSSGRASVVIRANDLAGNALDGGGEFGSNQDLATVYLQERYDSTIDTESLEFDSLEGLLLLGHQHHFNFTITDGNGITSLDKIELALLGRDQTSACFIEYQPRYAQVTTDEACFETEPTVLIEQQGNQQAWTVSMAFRLAWNLSETPFSQPAVPSLKVFDEGQDLGLGLSRLTVFEWNMSFSLQLQSVLFEDLTLPIGDTGDDHLWVHRNDMLLLTLELTHLHTQVPAEFVPNSLIGHAVLSDGERSLLSNLTFDDEGRSQHSIHISDDVVKHNTGFIELIFEHPLLIYDQRTNLTIDRFAPQLTVPPGTLDIVDSDALEAQEIIVILTDQEGLGETPIIAHWHFLRQGVPVPNSQGSAHIDKSAGTGTTNTYAGNVDMSPDATVILERDDRVQVWFSASDLAGRNITGFGTSESPMTPVFRWVAFEPRFDDIKVTPYRAIVGENISIFVRVANEGLLGGNITVHLEDVDGRVLEQNTTRLEPGTWVEYAWSVETWDTGRLGLSVVLVDVTGNIPLPMGEVQSTPNANQGAINTLGFAVLVVILAAGVLGFTLYRRQENLNEFTQKQVDAALLERSQPPPRPAGLDDLGEEQ